MIIEQAPGYNAAPSGLRASYSINFQSDSAHLIPLNAQWQGDRVNARSIFVDNSLNSNTIQLITNGNVQTVPAYSYGYADIAGAENVQLTTTYAGSISCNILTWREAPGFVAASQNVVVSGTTDSLYSSVIGLYHSEGVNGFLLANNSVTAAGRLDNMTLSIGAQISTAQKKFGTSSILAPSGGAGNGGVIGAPAYNKSNGMTIEFFQRNPSFSNAQTQYVGLTIGNNDLCCGHTNGPGGSSKGRPAIYWSGGPITATAPNQDYMNADTFYHLAYTLISDQVLMFLDGVNVYSGAFSTAASSVISAVKLINNGAVGNQYTDEIRITNYARYLSDFIAPSATFPDA